MNYHLIHFPPFPPHDEKGKMRMRRDRAEADRMQAELEAAEDVEDVEDVEANEEAEAEAAVDTEATVDVSLGGDEGAEQVGEASSPSKSSLETLDIEANTNTPPHTHRNTHAPSACPRGAQAVRDDDDDDDDDGRRCVRCYGGRCRCPPVARSRWNSTRCGWRWIKCRSDTLLSHLPAFSPLVTMTSHHSGYPLRVTRPLLT